MTQDVKEALALWGLEGAECRLVAQRENTVWRVEAGNETLALRFHRPGYRTDAELRSELDWMAALAEGGLNVPKPIACRTGQLVCKIGNQNLSLLTWLSGAPIGAVGRLEPGLDPFVLCCHIGKAIAQMHDVTDAWRPTNDIARPDWRADGLLGDDPLWGRFWEHPDLTPAQRDLFLKARDAARDALDRLDSTLDQGLIHADLVAENVLCEQDIVSFIDFDDCAFGYRDFELATLLLKFHGRPYYQDMQRGLLQGYAGRRPVDPEHLRLMLLVRALSYPGWIMSRLDEPGGRKRSDRAIEAAIECAQDFLQEEKR
jgi:Ser/Thr protein kinase RdoA (MazF antagonist)